MSRETAVTEEITYDTQDCKTCGTEVATDPSAPANTFEPHGYAVVLGEGKFRQEIEYEGNWDKELYFEREQEDNHLPTVEGYIICEDCAQSIHQHPEVARKYTGRIPNDLQPISLSLFQFSSTKSGTQQPYAGQGDADLDSVSLRILLINNPIIAVVLATLALFLIFVLLL